MEDVGVLESPGGKGWPERGHAWPRVATLCVARRSHAAPTTLLFEHGTNELLELPPPPIRLS